jgi:putative tryptophan/tyrosine transport system substrate-binding protein
MKRREFIAAIGGAVGWPMVAPAQQPPLPVIGFLDAGSANASVHYATAFREGLSETGYVVGKNVAIEYRWAEGRFDRLPVLVADLVRRQVAVIVAGGGAPAALAAKAATTTIPIVFQIGDDPVKFGLVSSLNRPGGNITGESAQNAELGPKRLELLHEVVPAATTLALLVNPTNPNAETLSRDLHAAARTLGLQLQVLRASAEREIDTAFATLFQLQAGGLMIGHDAFFNSQNERLAALALRHAMPTIYQFREFAAAGGLMSYGTDLADTYHQGGVYAGRILKGEKPGDLPVQQPTKFVFVINLKTAKALGLTIPEALLAIADQVIE